jgi:hypothetical protein
MAATNRTGVGQIATSSDVVGTRIIFGERLIFRERVSGSFQKLGLGPILDGRM